MVSETIDHTCVYFCRMNRNVMRPSPNVALMAARPPKPPCWRDFVSPSNFQNLTDSEFTDISKVARSSNESSSDGIFVNKQGKQKRVRARIHRTRSQFTIEESDLPEETLTVTLAETKPDDLGLRRDSAFDERIFQEDNNRKCQTWLQGIEACKPLEEVVSYDVNYDFNDEIKNEVSYKKLTDSDTEDIAMEIPDDTLWYDSTVLHSSGSECTLESKPVKKISLHRSRTHALLKFQGNDKSHTDVRQTNTHDKHKNTG